MAWYDKHKLKIKILENTIECGIALIFNACEPINFVCFSPSGAEC